MIYTSYCNVPKYISKCRNLDILFEPRNVDEHAQRAQITEKGTSQVQPIFQATFCVI